MTIGNEEGRKMRIVKEEIKIKKIDTPCVDFINIVIYNDQNKLAFVVKF